jgi:hypothetical protein
MNQLVLGTLKVEEVLYSWLLFCVGRVPCLLKTHHPIIVVLGALSTGTPQSTALSFLQQGLLELQPAWKKGSHY